MEWRGKILTQMTMLLISLTYLRFKLKNKTCRYKYRYTYISIRPAFYLLKFLTDYSLLEKNHNGHYLMSNYNVPLYKALTHIA